MKKLIALITCSTLFVSLSLAQEESKPAASPVKNIIAEPVQIKSQEIIPVAEKKAAPVNQRRTATEVSLPADTAQNKNSLPKAMPGSGRNETNSGIEKQ
jgi:hypothetical protein